MDQDANRLIFWCVFMVCLTAIICTCVIVSFTYVMPAMAERIGHRLMNQAKAIRSVWEALRHDDDLEPKYLPAALFPLPPTVHQKLRKVRVPKVPPL